ncbi:hypothetical protein F5Y03DRAFT_397939 [Xylaria venustula]|nr:hypothetical protein F5Y03DRAFT_397939 [Xylaria venustula]
MAERAHVLEGMRSWDNNKSVVLVSTPALIIGLQRANYVVLFEPSLRTLAFPEAKKWRWKQKLVLVIDEVSMLRGATLYDISCNLQTLRDCYDKPFGGIPVVLLLGDFY